MQLYLTFLLNTDQGYCDWLILNYYLEGVTPKN